MNRRFALAGTLGLALALTAGLAMGQDAEKSKPEAAKIGEAAPAFTLTDVAGKAHKLADYKGKIVVLQWINPDCPVCLGAMTDGRVKKMVEELKKADPNVVHLTVNSTHYMAAETTGKYLKDHKMAAPGLIDQDGTVGHLYGARTTPHLFVVDQLGVLRYSGAIDNASRGSEPTMNYAVNAVQQIVAGSTVAPDSTRPYGCSVKYAKGQKKGRKEGRGGFGR